MSDINRQIPEITLERYALGELDGETKATVEARLAADPALREALAGIEASNAAVLAEYPPALQAEAINRSYARELKSRGVGRRASRLRLITIPLASAAALAFVWAVAVHDWQGKGGGGALVPPGQSDREVTRVKGLSPHLVVHRVGPSGAERLGDEAVAKAGDTLQVSYVAAGRTHGVIVSIDGRGRVTVHLPLGGDAAAALDPKGERPLAVSFELDDAPRFERFFFVVSDAPFSVGEVTGACEALAMDPAKAATDPLTLPKALSQSTFVLRKAAP